MMMRNPIQDQVAIIGVGTTAYARSLKGKTAGALAVEAGRAAIRDAGLQAEDIDGVCGTAAGVWPQYVQEGLGIPRTSWWDTPPMPIIFCLIEAVNAVFSGACECALVYHSRYRTGGTSRSAAQDPFRRIVPTADVDPSANRQFQAPYSAAYAGAAGYAGLMRRYMHEHGVDREVFGRIAMNGRSNARTNPHAVMRSPLGMDEYLAARMVREPMCLLDMDLPVDGGDALVVTTVDRARRLNIKPVYIHAYSYGQDEHPGEAMAGQFGQLGQNIAAELLWQRSAIALDEVDIFFPYDGFTIITVQWFESLGYCGLGEADGYLKRNWDEREARLRLGGRILVNPHGGSLSEGASQGIGHIREAVVQLRGEAGERQSHGAKVALVANGGLFFNSTTLMLRAD